MFINYVLHESDLENNIKITDTDINFEIIYNKNYIPQQYINEIKKANVLIIPSEGFRDDNDICYFPECTSEFYGFLKNKKKIQTEICIDDDHFQTLELHVIPVPTMELKSHFRGYLLGSIRSFFKKKNGRKSEETYERSVVRPVFSYYGKLTFTDDVLQHLIQHSLTGIHGIAGVNKVKVGKSTQDVGNGIDVMTKLDGDARGGAALSIKAVTGKPIKFIGVSEKLDGLEEFHPDRYASRILDLGDVETIIEKAQAAFDEESMAATWEKPAVLPGCLRIRAYLL